MHLQARPFRHSPGHVRAATGATELWLQLPPEEAVSQRRVHSRDSGLLCRSRSVGTTSTSLLWCHLGRWAGLVRKSDRWSAPPALPHSDSASPPPLFDEVLFARSDTGKSAGHCLSCAEDKGSNDSVSDHGPWHGGLGPEQTQAQPALLTVTCSA